MHNQLFQLCWKIGLETFFKYFVCAAVFQDNPKQMNGSDCGMFSCMYAEYLSRKAKINFSQSDMPYFRRKMAYEISIARLLL